MVTIMAVGAVQGRVYRGTSGSSGNNNKNQWSACDATPPQRFGLSSIGIFNIVTVPISSQYSINAWTVNCSFVIFQENKDER